MAKLPDYEYFSPYDTFKKKTFLDGFSWICVSSFFLLLLLSVYYRAFSDVGHMFPVSRIHQFLPFPGSLYVRISFLLSFRFPFFVLIFHFSFSVGGIEVG